MNRRFLRLWIFVFLLLALGRPSGAAVWEINVNTIVTPAGKRIQHPTSGNPAFYYPYVIGYEEVGSIAAGNKIPADAAIKHAIAEALASQGYFVTHVNGTKLDPPPSLILVLRWGNISAVRYDDVDDNGARTHNYNERAHQKEMLLVGVKLSDFGDDRLVKKDLISSADKNRYYVVISAYDFGTYYTKHKTVLLWISRMSVSRQDLDLDQVIPSLISAGTPFLGRETLEPRIIDVQAPTGKVDIGTPMIKGYVEPGTTKPGASAQP
ncbi:MAG TPA: hypothetical protein VMI53_03510 [Opitutaceae bacterium]|nr:hypothetical protein [Opitutaceae bacterium]